MNIRFILTTLGLLSAMSLSAERTSAQCLEYDKNTSGKCIRETFIEDGYLVNGCTAAAQGACTVTTTVGSRTATCTAKDGNQCFARVKMN